MTSLTGKKQEGCFGSIKRDATQLPAYHLFLFAFMSDFCLVFYGIITVFCA